MGKQKHKIQVSTGQIDAAIARARQFESNDPRVVKAQYQAKEDLVSLCLSDGVRVSIPRRQLQGLEHANQSQLTKIE